MKIMLGLPGVSWPEEAFISVIQASQEHEVNVKFSSGPAHNFNNLWACALNLAEIGELDRFVMLHADTFPGALVEGQWQPGQWWLDALERERERVSAALVSVAISIKDMRGIYSCGVGNPDNLWAPKRRWTIREAADYPETWSVADAGHPGEMTLHNNGCWIADLHDQRFFETDERGYLKCSFDFPTRIYRDPNGKLATDGESEDWYFSRKLWELGITNTYVTRAVPLHHRGSIDYPNYVIDKENPSIQWFKRDWHTEPYWNKKPEPANA